MKLPDGTELVRVPRDPTPEQVEAGRTALGQDKDGVQTHARTMWCYEAMLAAAPQPPEDELERMIVEAIEEEAGCSGVYSTIARTIVKRLIGGE